MLALMQVCLTVALYVWNHLIYTQETLEESDVLSSALLRVILQPLCRNSELPSQVSIKIFNGVFISECHCRCAQPRN